MRILDLGCSDGLIGGWLKAQFPGRPLTVDGLDLDTKALELAKGRLSQVKQGRAEDAYKLYDPQSYDAVVAFEILEHVPDIKLLLDTCEQMVKADGKIFISTPDGTYGQGYNPNHLRALRAVEFADLLRRRGTLRSFGVGEDNIAVGCYTPAEKRLEVAIFTGPTVPWHPMDIASKGLGGSETAAYRVGEALAKQGHVVTLYGRFEQEGAMCDLILRDWQTFDPTEPRDAVIVSRMPAVFDRPINAPVRVLWMHDTDYGPQLTEQRAEQMTHVVTLSTWHQAFVATTYPFLADKLKVIGNGITPGYYQPRDIDREQRVVYTSSPDRGLDILLDLWPLVLEQVPEARLVCCYPDYFDMAADSNPELATFRDGLKAKIASMDSVHSAGSLSLPKVAELLRSSMVWAHPSYNTPNQQKFYETFCISALEAQACGCRAVAGGWGALPETISTGVLVEGDPTTEKWKHQFAMHLIESLTNVDVRQMAQTAGPEEIAGQDWASVGELFDHLIQG